MPFSRCRFHLVWATKNRDPMIDAEMEPIIHQALFTKAKDCGAQVIVANGVADHIHLIAAIPPAVYIPDLVRELKTGSSRAVHLALPHKKIFAWQRGYGIFTLDSRDFQGAVQYVVHQKEHHAKKTLWDLFERWEE